MTTHSNKNERSPNSRTSAQNVGIFAVAMAFFLCRCILMERRVLRSYEFQEPYYVNDERKSKHDTSIRLPSIEEPKSPSNQSLPICVQGNSCWNEDPHRQSVAEALGSVNLQSIPLPPNYSGYVAPMWSCQTDNPTRRHKRLIFVHVFKTAGSTLRRFFLSYGGSCGRGVATIAQCAHLAVQSMESVWRAPNGRPCISKVAINRSGEVLLNPQSLVSTDLVRTELDILAGHLPIGAGAGWKDANNEPVSSQYVAFFREPISKRVSGHLYVNSHLNWTFDEAVQDIRRFVLKEVQKGNYYNAYTRYLTTPQQKESFPEIGTDEGAVAVAVNNLVQFPVVVGIVEKMTDSLSLLQHVVDGDRQFDSVFKTIDPSGGSSSTNATKLLMANKSALSTRAIVANITQDVKFLQHLREYLKFEYLLYDFALQLHERQVKSLRTQI